MGSYFPNERDLRQMREAALEAAPIQDQVRQVDVRSHIYTIQDALEERRRIERELRAPDAARHLQEAAQVLRASGVSQLDLQSAAQQALDQHERLRETVGDQTLVAAAVAGEQRAQAIARRQPRGRHNKATGRGLPRPDAWARTGVALR
jgi:hypothetical protein